MISRIFYKRTFLFSILLFLLGGSLFIGTNEALAATGQLTWEARDWNLNYHSTSTISVVDVQGRNDVLRFYKWDNYHAQASSQIRGLGNEASMVVEVDFYADYVYSWSWAPVLKLTWPSAGVTAWIKKQAGSYAQWGVTGSSPQQASGKMYQDRWYTMRIFVEKITWNGVDLTHIVLSIRDVTNNGNWDVLYDNSVSGHLTENPILYLGTDRTTDYSSVYRQELFYYDNFGIRNWEDRRWDYYAHSSSRVTQGVFQGRESVLAFYKPANYHAQYRRMMDLQVADSVDKVFEVDFYADYMYSWSWAPGLKVTWPDSGGFTAWIKKQAGSYAQWGITGFSQQAPGTMYEDRWYTIRIKVDNTYEPQFQIWLTNIIIQIKDITNNGNWVTLLNKAHSGGLLNGDPVVTIGTDRTTDYSVAGSYERYYFDRFRVQFDDGGELAWWNDVLDVEDAHAAGYLGQGTVIAVIDTGLTSSYTSLFPSGSILTTYSKSITKELGYDNVDWNQDTNGHGTMVTSVILGFNVPSSYGYENNFVLGVAPKAQVVMIRAFGGSVDSWDNVSYRITEAINYAIDLHNNQLADKNMVISISGGIPSSVSLSKTRDQALRDAVTNARSAGIAVSVAAGNEGPSSDTVRKPAAYDDATSVAAAAWSGYTTGTQYNLDDDMPEGDFADLGIASFSSRGKIEITSIGDGYYLPKTSSNYVDTDGTSFACPQISGIYALLFSKFGDRTVDFLENQMLSTTYYMSPADAWGSGFVQVDDALGIHSVLD